MAIVEIHSHYIGLINTSCNTSLNEKAAKYSKLLGVAARAILDSCKSSTTDSVCATKGVYLDIARKIKNAQLPAGRKNATEVLAILK